MKARTSALFRVVLPAGGARAQCAARNRMRLGFDDPELLPSLLS